LGIRASCSLDGSAFREDLARITDAAIKTGFGTRSAYACLNSLTLRDTVANGSQDAAPESKGKGGKAVQDAVGIANVFSNFHVPKARAAAHVHAAAAVVAATATSLFPLGWHLLLFYCRWM
jgi:hypothetical protein